MGSLTEKLDLGIEELLLVFLISLDVLEFAGLLSLELDYIKKIVSWVCLGYLIYLASPSEIFYGYKDKVVDTLMILGYFSLVLNDFVSSAADILSSMTADSAQAAISDSFLLPLYVFVTEHATVIISYSIYSGLGLLLLVSCFNLFMNVEIREPSIMAIFHRKGAADGMAGKLLRTFSSFFLTLGFFFIIFKMVVEWLGWVVDSSLLVLAIFFYFFFIIKRAKRYDPETLIFKIGNLGEEFYSRFISLFHSRSTVMMGIMGMLVLHLLTEIGVFILPYILGKDILYFGGLGEGHTVLWPLLLADLSLAPAIASKAAVVLVYALNVLAILSILIGPAFIWYDLYANRFLSSRKWLNGLFFAALAAFLINPLFSLGKLVSGSVAGADIRTVAIDVPSALLTALISFGIFAAVFGLSYSHLIKRGIKHLFIIVVNVFLGYYLYFFAGAMIEVHIASLSALRFSNVVLSLFLIFSLVALLLFYVFGFISFLIKSFHLGVALSGKDAKTAVEEEEVFISAGQDIKK